jgi:hypothetical protein
VWQSMMMGDESHRNGWHWLTSLRHPARRDGLIALALLLLPGFIAIALSRHGHELDSTVVTTLISISLGAPVMWLTWATYREARWSDGGIRKIDLSEIADRLATAVGTQWNAEAAIRRLNDPYPLPVSWEPVKESMIDSWQGLVQLASSGAGWSAPPSPSTWANGPDELAGSDSDLMTILLRVPTRRLLVLGQPGAGKTVLLIRLVLDLLTHRRSGEQVPILLPLSSWNPAEQGLRDWIVSRMIIQWPLLDETVADKDITIGSGTSMSIARTLFDKGLILPLLDGLDEIPSEARGHAIAGINNAIYTGHSLILASRTDAYESAVRPAHGATAWLKGAAGIELRPLKTAAVADYLRQSAGPSRAVLWDRVIATLASRRRSPLTQALATPLMVSLARAVYSPQPGEEIDATLPEPKELTNRKQFPTAKAIEEYLLDRYVSASYMRPPEPRWTIPEAENWLRFLAKELQYSKDGTLEQAGTTEFEWWKLPDAAPRHLAGIAAGTIAAVACGLGYPYVGLGVGLILGICAGLIVRKKFTSGRTGFTSGMVGGLLGGTAAALIALAALGPGPGASQLGSFLAGGITVGIMLTSMGEFNSSLAAAFVAELAIAFYEQDTLFRHIRTEVGSGLHIFNGLGTGLSALMAVQSLSYTTPARGLRWSPGRFFCGVASGIVGAIVVGIQVGRGAGLVVLTVCIIAATVFGYNEAVATDLTEATQPKTALLHDRATFLASGLGFGLALGVTTGFSVALLPPYGGAGRIGFLPGLGVGLANLIGWGPTMGFVQARWGSYTVSRYWLAMSGILPWRLMSFLDDAYARRGILRQFGAAYQFRHAELQRRLADPGFRE